MESHAYHLFYHALIQNTLAYLAWMLEMILKCQPTLNRHRVLKHPELVPILLFQKQGLMKAPETFSKTDHFQKQV